MATDPHLYGDDDTVDRLLRDTEVWAVVGLSTDQTRDAYGVARLLQSKGKRIVPVHPRAETVHGEQGYASVADAAFAVGPLDVVDCFVNSQRVGQIVDDAIAVGAKAVWLQLDVIVLVDDVQLDVIDEDAAQRARDAGLEVVMNRCPAIEWRRGRG
mgnify:CR=1 FL=1